MRRALKWAVCLGAMVSASPVLATGGYYCSTTDGSDISVNATVGRTPIPAVVGVVVSIKGKVHNEKDGDPKLLMQQVWFDDERVMFDFVEPESLEPLLHVRTLYREGQTAKSTITYQTKVHPAECEFE